MTRQKSKTSPFLVASLAFRPIYNTCRHTQNQLRTSATLGSKLKAFVDYDKYINFTGEKTEDQLKEEGIACFKKQVINSSLSIYDWFDDHKPLILVNECCCSSRNMYKHLFHFVVANLESHEKHVHVCPFRRSQRRDGN